MPAIAGSTVMLEESATFEVRGEMFFIRLGNFTFAMPPSVFTASFGNAAECLHIFRTVPRRAAEVIHVDFNSKFERVYPKDKIA